MHKPNEERERTRCEPMQHGVAPPGPPQEVGDVEGAVEAVKQLTDVMVAFSMHHVKEDSKCVEGSPPTVRRALVHKLLD